MESATRDVHQLGTSPRVLAKRLLTIGENRFELLMIEMQEERERILKSVLLALGVAVFGLLAGIALTATIAVLLWNYSPTVVLIALTALYGLTAIYLYEQLNSLLRNWSMFSATFDQLKKDRACLENILE